MISPLWQPAPQENQYLFGPRFLDDQVGDRRLEHGDAIPSVADTPDQRRFSPGGISVTSYKASKSMQPVDEFRTRVPDRDANGSLTELETSLAIDDPRDVGSFFNRKRSNSALPSRNQLRVSLDVWPLKAPKPTQSRNSLRRRFCWLATSTLAATRRYLVRGWQSPRRQELSLDLVTWDVSKPLPRLAQGRHRLPAAASTKLHVLNVAGILRESEV
ncbi:MAG: hypothetical protein HW375_40 [Anaerolineales bacterium]|nr:hypothetical protein [Anaerolineales bacterium]